MKTTKLFIIITIILSLLINPVYSDGCLVIPPLYTTHTIGDSDLFELHPEKQQYCFINYDGTTQNMLLSIDVEGGLKNNSLWLFPVPSKPDDIDIDIIKEMPKFEGQNLIESAFGSVESSVELMRYHMNIFSFLSKITNPYDYIMHSTMEMGALGSSSTTKVVNADIQIHAHIEKDGITTELITAKNPDAIYQYVKTKDMTLPKEVLSVFDDYIGKEYSFVLSWISGNTDNKQQPGISISFHTKKMFFPLKPTSVYGNLKVPAIIYVAGHVSPKIYKSIADDTDIYYFIQNNYNVPENLKPFFFDKETIPTLKYTKIKIDTSSNNFVEDLWISNRGPTSTKLAQLITHNESKYYLFNFLLISILASIIAGTISFGTKNVSRIKLLLIGLTNYFSILGVAISMFFTKLKNTEPAINTTTNPENSMPTKQLYKKILALIPISFSITILCISNAFISSVIPYSSDLFSNISFGGVLPAFIFVFLIVFIILISIIIIVNLLDSLFKDRIGITYQRGLHLILFVLIFGVLSHIFKYNYAIFPLCILSIVVYLFFTKPKNTEPTINTTINPENIIPNTKSRKILAYLRIYFGISILMSIFGLIFLNIDSFSDLFFCFIFCFIIISIILTILIQIIKFLSLLFKGKITINHKRVLFLILFFLIFKALVYIFEYIYLILLW